MNIESYNPSRWFSGWFDDENRQNLDILPKTRRSQLHQEIDRLFEEAFRGFGMPSLHAVGDHHNRGTTFLKPNINIAKSDKEYKVIVEVPGVNEDDVKVELANGILTISGEKRKDNEEHEEKYYRVEHSYGAFRRSLSLPEDVEEDQINATFKNGVLNLLLPRKASPDSAVKHIEVKKAE